MRIACMRWTRERREKAGKPVLMVQATYPGTGEEAARLVIQSQNYKQRPEPAAVERRGLYQVVVALRYRGLSRLADRDITAKTLSKSRCTTTRPNGSQGSFWGGGAAPAGRFSEEISIWSPATARSTPKAEVTDLGESVIKLSSAGGLTARIISRPSISRHN